MIKKWNVVRSENLNSYKVFSTRKDISISPITGENHDFYVVEAPNWVNVVAITADDQMILIEQYRHGTRSITLEIPGGMVDPDESPLEAARRELLEETGHDCDEWVCIGTINPNPAIQSNTCYTFLASNARRVQGEAEGGPAAAPPPPAHQRQPGLGRRESKITHALV